jgi:hypothetical protein
MIEAQVEAEENKNADGDGFWQAAVEIHGLVDPVTVAEVPDESTKIAKCRALAESKWVSSLVVSEDRRKKR